MAVIGELNQAFTGDNEEARRPAETTGSRHHSVQIDDYDDTNAINMMTNSYEYYSNLNMCVDGNARETTTDTIALDSVKTTNNTSTSCCIDICDDDLKTKNTISISDNNNTYEEYSYCNITFSSNCDTGVDMNFVRGKSPSSSRCSTGSLSCTNIVSDSNFGRIYYNCNRTDPRLKLNIFPDTTLTSPVPMETTTSCCDCETSSSTEYTNIENSEYKEKAIVTPAKECDCGTGSSMLYTNIENSNCKEKAIVDPVRDEESEYCCRCSAPPSQDSPTMLTRSLTEHSIKSCTDELPSYRSLIAFRLKDSPPNYESVTGIRVNVDEIRKDVSSYTRNRLRREVRTCSDLNSSAKRLLVLMAAIIIAICIVMIILTI